MAHLKSPIMQRRLGREGGAAGKNRQRGLFQKTIFISKNS